MKTMMIASTLALALTTMGCASMSSSATSAHETASSDPCEAYRQSMRSAWIHGEGAPAGQAQIGWRRSMEEQTEQRVELAASCATPGQQAY